MNTHQCYIYICIYVLRHPKQSYNKEKTKQLKWQISDRPTATPHSGTPCWSLPPTGAFEKRDLNRKHV